MPSEAAERPLISDTLRWSGGSDAFIDECSVADVVVSADAVHPGVGVTLGAMVDVLEDVVFAWDAIEDCCDFILGTFAGGGIRRPAPTFPKVCKPCFGAARD